jgi:hypothetical protein
VGKELKERVDEWDQDYSYRIWNFSIFHVFSVYMQIRWIYAIENLDLQSHNGYKFKW